MAKKTVVRFLEPDELRAACNFMGAENQGFSNDPRLLRIVKESGTNYSQMAQRIEHWLGSFAESDEMFEGMIAECRWFKKDFNSKNVKDRAYWIAEWEKALDKAKNLK